MRVYLTDGTSFECGGYKALDSGGVVLTEDRKRKHVVGYVPEDALVYILPDDVAAARDAEMGVEGVAPAPADVVAEHTHDDVVERVAGLESRVDGLEGRVDAMTGQLADVVTRVEAGDDERRAPDDVRNVRGIGEAYATRLRASGIETVTALRDASESDLTAATNVSERRVREWKRRADAYAESELAGDDADGDSEA